MSASTPWIETGVTRFLVLLQSTIKSLLFVTLILLTPCDKGVDHSPILHLNTLTNVSTHCRVIRKFLKMAALCAVAKVCGAEGEEEGGEDGPLWFPCVADHLVRHTMLKMHILWSSWQVINNLGHERHIHLQRCQRIIQKGWPDGTEWLEGWGLKRQSGPDPQPRVWGTRQRRHRGHRKKCLRNGFSLFSQSSWSAQNGHSRLSCQPKVYICTNTVARRTQWTVSYSFMTFKVFKVLPLCLKTSHITYEGFYIHTTNCWFSEAPNFAWPSHKIRSTI